MLTDGTRREIEGKPYIWFDGCWIHYYEPPPNTLENKKSLIDHLTRRTFHHTEPGINTPGDRLQSARSAYEKETDPKRKRVNAAMLAGALFNHATDIFTAIVELEAKGVGISRSNELMKECGACFKEALELGKQVKHYSGEEGIDELWGEPFRAFTISVEQFYTSRYIKIAQTWHNIDRIVDILKETFSGFVFFEALESQIHCFANAAKRESETMKSDEHIFQVWPEFIATGENLENFHPPIPEPASNSLCYALGEAHDLIKQGKNLINWIASARVPMPKSTSAYGELCADFRVRLQHCYNKQD
ncbi:MAG: hypothetical protein KDJ38_19260 [Gammaproteobacteria bacterium]|nr:hypothetical protein [Gammaproteobacteria bacterium]